MDSQIQELAKIIQKSKKILVVTGAGISTNGGIPDFRSTDGLYNLVKTQYPSANILKGKDLFDANLFKDPTTTKIFYLFMAKLRTMVNDANPCISHAFLKYLDTGNKLQRCYTQNIDSLEKRLAGTVEAKQEFEKRVIQLHGDLDLLICTLCRATFPFSEHHIANYEESIVPSCPTCVVKNETRMMLGKRQVSVGMLRPNIILYNEHHAQGDIIADTLAADLKKKPDLLIVMGTSLKVVGVKRLVREIASTIRNTGKGVRVVLINKCELGADWTDFFDMQILEKTSDEVCDGLMIEIERIKTTRGTVKISEKKENTKIASKKTIKKEVAASTTGKKSDIKKVPFKPSAKKQASSSIQSTVCGFTNKMDLEVKGIKKEVKIDLKEAIIEESVDIGKGKVMVG